MIDTTLQLVTFQLGVENYGIDIMDVKEIYSVQEVRDIPNAPSYVEGIFNLRGDIIPVINLHKRFHLRKAELTEDEELLSGFIIINLDGMQLGVIIDKVLRVVTVDRDQIQPPPQMITGIGTEYIQGVIHQDSGYLIILDIHRLFDPDELQQIGLMNRSR
ncbi:MAG: chemotaxis protein CheW [Spirochaetaceae bacterium 4572_59]|nr:MAG: chemotaxis protein CheW [Spirochaetaceae bacterium 4572_59]